MCVPPNNTVGSLTKVAGFENNGAGLLFHPSAGINMYPDDVNIPCRTASDILAAVKSRLHQSNPTRRSPLPGR